MKKQMTAVIVLFILLVLAIGSIWKLNNRPVFDTSTEALQNNLRESEKKRVQESKNGSDKESLQMKNSVMYNVGDYIEGLDDVRFIGFLGNHYGRLSVVFSVKGQELYYRITEDRKDEEVIFLIGEKKVRVTDSELNTITLSVLENN